MILGPSKAIISSAMTASKPTTTISCTARCSGCAIGSATRNSSTGTSCRCLWRPLPSGCTRSFGTRRANGSRVCLAHSPQTCTCRTFLWRAGGCPGHPRWGRGRCLRCSCHYSFLGSCVVQLNGAVDFSSVRLPRWGFSGTCISSQPLISRSSWDSRFCFGVASRGRTSGVSPLVERQRS